MATPRDNCLPGGIGYGNVAHWNLAEPLRLANESTYTGTVDELKPGLPFVFQTSEGTDGIELIMAKNWERVVTLA